jgi:hypothetical protein
METWRGIPDFPKYEVSSLGRVRRAAPGTNTRAGLILKTPPDSRGYPMVIFYGSGKRFARKVHRLVAESFLGPRPTPLHEVAHADGSRDNNAVVNLRWATRADNHADKLRHGTDNRGGRHGMSKLTEALIRTAEARRKEGARIKDIARELGVSHRTLGKALRRESWCWLP